ncbi:MAG: type II secretion system F family protein [Syntrophomonadaceae bacterium]|jgi:type IV pilus assembly protein PilC|nr:type II secretion system F family protein [Syntrophomonadaceae bacterium]
MSDEELNKKNRSVKLQPKELVTFCSQMALFLRAGVPLEEGLEYLSEDVKGSPLEAALLKVNQHVQEHEYFHSALGKSGSFPGYMVSMVEIGETSGKMDDILDSLAKFYSRELALKQRIQNAVTYPLTLIVMMSLVVLLLIAKVLPLFENILISLGSEMPGSVKVIMSVSNFLNHNGILIILLLIVLFVAGKMWKATNAGRSFFERIKVTLPVFKPIYQKIYTERFANAMAFMMEAGINIDSALELSKTIIDNNYMQQKIRICIDLIQQGRSLHEALYESGSFPKLFTRMLGLAQKTGELDVMLYRLSGIYENEVNIALKRATSVVEPALVVVLSIIVGIILISIMLPLINIMSSIG